MHFGGNIFTGKTNPSDIAFCGNPTKRHDGEGQKDEPLMNGELNTKSLKERIVMLFIELMIVGVAGFALGYAIGKSR